MSGKNNTNIRIKFEGYLKAVSIIFIVNLFLMIVDPFGVDSALDFHASKTISKIASIAYPPKDGDGAPPAQKSISVILLNDGTHDGDQRWPWPPSFENYNTLLDDIVSLKPRAIFIDLLFFEKYIGKKTKDSSSIEVLLKKIGEITKLKERETTDTPYIDSQLEKLKFIQKNKGIPIIVAANSVDDIDIVKTAQHPLFSEPGIENLNSINKVAILAPVSISKTDQSYPLSIGLSCTKQAHCYNTRYYTPAMLQYILHRNLHRDEHKHSYMNEHEHDHKHHYKYSHEHKHKHNYIHDHERRHKHNHDNDLGHTPFFLSEFRDNLHVEWGWKLDDDDHLIACIMSYSCNYEPDNNQEIDNRKSNIVRLSIEEVLYNFFRTNQENTRAPYHPVVTTSLFYRLKIMNNFDLIEPLIKDRFITIGTSLSGVKDSIYSPVHGSLPGAFYHTMALDNLMEHGDNYSKSPGVFASFPTTKSHTYTLDWGEIFELSMVLFSFSIVYLLTGLYYQKRSKFHLSMDHKKDHMTPILVISFVAISTLTIYLNSAIDRSFTSYFTGIFYCAFIMFIYAAFLVKNRMLNLSISTLVYKFLSLLLICTINLMCLAYLDEPYIGIYIIATLILTGLLCFIVLFIDPQDTETDITNSLSQPLSNLTNLIFIIVLSILLSIYIASIFIAAFDLPPYDWAKTALFSLVAYYGYRDYLRHSETITQGEIR